MLNVILIINLVAIVVVIATLCVIMVVLIKIDDLVNILKAKINAEPITERRSSKVSSRGSGSAPRPRQATSPGPASVPLPDPADLDFLKNPPRPEGGFGSSG